MRVYVVGDWVETMDKYEPWDFHLDHNMLPIDYEIEEGLEFSAFFAVAWDEPWFGDRELWEE